MRRIICKSVSRILKDDIKKSTGNLRSCSGVEGGIEAVIHAIRTAFQEDESKAVLLVDATNAFNSMNRKVAQQNI